MELKNSRELVSLHREGMDAWRREMCWRPGALPARSELQAAWRKILVTPDG